MNQEQEQEKLLNAAGQVVNNAATGVMHLTSLIKPKTKIEVKSAKDDLHNTRLDLKNGVNVQKITQTLQKSLVAEEIKKMGGNVSRYSQAILRKAKIENKVEAQEKTGQSKEEKQLRNQEQQYQR